MLSRHDQLLLADLDWQPVWLPILYIAVGCAGVGVALWQVVQLEVALLATGGGFLLALGCEKLVSRRIRRIARTLACRPE